MLVKESEWKIKSRILISFRWPRSSDAVLISYSNCLIRATEILILCSFLRQFMLEFWKYLRNLIINSTTLRKFYPDDAFCNVRMLIFKHESIFVEKFVLTMLQLNISKCNVQYWFFHFKTILSHSLSFIFFFTYPFLIRKFAFHIGIFNIF